MSQDPTREPVDPKLDPNVEPGSFRPAEEEPDDKPVTDGDGDDTLVQGAGNESPADEESPVEDAPSDVKKDDDENVRGT